MSINRLNPDVTRHDTFLDVLLQIRHNNFEVFDKGFVMTEEQDLAAGYHQIDMCDGTRYAAQRYDDVMTSYWELEECVDLMG